MDEEDPIQNFLDSHEFWDLVFGFIERSLVPPGLKFEERYHDLELSLRVQERLWHILRYLEAKRLGKTTLQLKRLTGFTNVEDAEKIHAMIERNNQIMDHETFFEYFPERVWEYAAPRVPPFTSNECTEEDRQLMIQARSHIKNVEHKYFRYQRWDNFW